MLAYIYFIFQEYISQRSTDLRKTFVKFDSNGDGKISRKEFRMVCLRICSLLTQELIWVVR